MFENIEKQFIELSQPMIENYKNVKRQDPDNHKDIKSINLLIGQLEALLMQLINTRNEKVNNNINKPLVVIDHFEGLIYHTALQHI